MPGSDGSKVAELASVSPIYYMAGERVHLVREEMITGIVKSDGKGLVEARKKLYKRHFISRNDGKNVLLKDIMMQKATLRRDKLLEDFVWIVCDDPHYEAATRQSLGRRDRVWPLFLQLLHAGIDIRRIRPEHILVNQNASDASWVEGDPTAGRMEENVKITHLWVATHGQFVDPQIFLNETVNTFIESLPQKSTTMASFCERDGNWHCRELQTKAPFVCDEGYTTRRQLEDHLESKHQVPRARIDGEIITDVDTEMLAEEYFQSSRLNMLLSQPISLEEIMEDEEQELEKAIRLSLQQDTIMNNVGEFADEQEFEAATHAAMEDGDEEELEAAILLSLRPDTEMGDREVWDLSVPESELRGSQQS